VEAYVTAWLKAGVPGTAIAYLSTRVDTPLGAT
jgi:hypothetical protein